MDKTKNALKIMFSAMNFDNEATYRAYMTLLQDSDDELLARTIIDICHNWEPGFGQKIPSIAYILKEYNHFLSMRKIDDPGISLKK